MKKATGKSYGKGTTRSKPHKKEEYTPLREKSEDGG